MPGALPTTLQSLIDGSLAEGVLRVQNLGPRRLTARRACTGSVAACRYMLLVVPAAPESRTFMRKITEIASVLWQTFHVKRFFSKVVVIMAIAWITNFFISVHPLLEASST